VDGTTMNYGVVTNWHIISYDSWMFFISAMYYSPILILTLLPILLIDISSDNCVKPNTARITKTHISNNCCIFSYVTIIGIIGLFPLTDFINIKI
jgi:hypothetical protein